MALKIKEREANITKVETLKSQTLAGNVDVSQYRNKPIDSFLKVEEDGIRQDMTMESVIGISIVGIVFLIACVSFVAYWIRRKRVTNMKGYGEGATKLPETNHPNERATTPPYPSKGDGQNGYQLKMTESTNHSIFMNDLMTQGIEAGPTNPQDYVNQQH